MKKIGFASVVLADDAHGAWGNRHIEVLKRTKIPYHNTANVHLLVLLREYPVYALLILKAYLVSIEFEIANVCADHVDHVVRIPAGHRSFDLQR